MSSSFGADALRSAGPSISLDNNSASGVGTYKGVMLCNRPFGGTEGAAQKASNGTTQFRAGKVPEVIGASNLKLRDKVKRPKKENALTRHRKWLAELQRTKDRLEAEYTMEQIKTKQKTDRFQKQEEKMRQSAKNLIKDSAKGGPETNESAIEEMTVSTLGSPITAEAKAETAPVAASAKDVSASSDAKSSTSAAALEAKGAANKHKPAWAFASEEEQTAAAEAKEMEDDEGLLDFAAGLDFERYMDDMEVQTMLAAVAARVRELEREVKQEGDRSTEALERQALRERIEAMGGDVSALDDDNSGVSSEGEALAFAKQVMADMEELKSVHSEKSVAQLYTKAKQEQSKAEVQLEPTTKALEHAGTPHIAVHDDSEGARMAEKKAIRKLPYMNRNPAV